MQITARPLHVCFWDIPLEWMQKQPFSILTKVVVCHYTLHAGCLRYGMIRLLGNGCTFQKNTYICGFFNPRRNTIVAVSRSLEHLPHVDAQQSRAVESLVHAGNLPVKKKHFDWPSAPWSHISRQIGLYGGRRPAVGLACRLINGRLDWAYQPIRERGRRSVLEVCPISEEEELPSSLSGGVGSVLVENYFYTLGKSCLV